MKEHTEAGRQIEAEHKEAQQSGEVFEGGFRGDGQ